MIFKYNNLCRGKSALLCLLYASAIAMLPCQIIHAQDAGVDKNWREKITRQLIDMNKRTRESGGFHKTDVPYDAYLQQVDHVLHRNLSRKKPADTCDLTLKAYIVFTISISKDGKVSKAKLLTPTGNKCLDDSVIEIVKNAELPAFPNEMSRKTHVLVVPKHITFVPGVKKRGNYHRLNVSFRQGAGKSGTDQSVPITSLRLKNSPFAIEVKSVPGHPAIQVCASESPGIFNQITPSFSSDDVRCYAPGTGMAVPETMPDNGWPLVLGQGIAHNYYNEARSDIRDGKQIARISEIISRGKVTLTSHVVHLIVFYDRNNNHKVDTGEYAFFSVDLAP